MKKQVTKKKLLKQINRFELRIITDDSTKIYDISEILDNAIKAVAEDNRAKQIQYFKNEIV